MKGKMKKVLALVVASSMLFTMSGCGKQGGKKEEKKDSKKGIAQEIEICVNESKELIPQLYDSTFKSEKTSIASVMNTGDGQIVWGVKEGSTTIVESNDNESVTYKVTVAPDNDCEDSRAFSAEGIVNGDEITSFVGGAYNVLTSGNLNANEASLEHPIFNIKKLVKDGKVTVNRVNKVRTTTIQGESMSKFSQDYNSQIAVGGTASYKKFFSVSINTDFSSIAKGNMEEKSIFLKIFTNIQTHKLSMGIGTDEYENYIDPSFYKDLKGDTGKSAEYVLMNYGTHAILSAMYGGRLDFDYFLSSSNATTSTEEMTKIAGEIKTSIMGFDASAKTNINESFKKEAAGKNINIRTTIDSVGGNLKDMRTLESVAAQYGDWLQSVEDKPTMIGMASQQSLYPIWELLPKNMDKRYNEFVNAFNKLADESYSELISTYKYNKKNSSIKRLGDTIEFGTYPQSQANTKVSRALDAGKGTSLGNYSIGVYDSCELFEYEGKRYVKYVPKDRMRNDPLVKYEIGKACYFKVEPITWTCYSEDSKKKIYLCDIILDAMSMHVGIMTSWNKASMKRYLEGGILDLAFDDEELDAMTYVPYYNSGFHDSRYNKSNDTISIAPYRGLTVEEDNSKGKATDFAHARGLRGEAYWIAASDFKNSNDDKVFGGVSTIGNFFERDDQESRGFGLLYRKKDEGKKTVWEADNAEINNYVYGLRPTIALSTEN